MLRALSQQVVKALPCFSTGTLRRIHSVQLPYSGPPSYEMVSRRFASQVDPQGYFARKREQDTLQRGQFTDIHDITPEEGIYPDEYDVSLTDITHETLMKAISDEIGIVYLSEATGDTKKPVSVCDGYIYGPNRRPVVPLVVSYGKQSRWVFFIVDSGSPWTFMSKQAIETLRIKIKDDDPHMAAIATIGGYPSPFRRSRLSSHYHDVNLLGADFCYFHKVRVMHDYHNLRTKLHIPGGGEVTEESEL